MPEMRPGHENRTDLYEGAKAKVEKQYWIEHPGMPERPTGLHGTTVSNTAMGALENVRSEIAAKEGTRGLQDGHHILHLMSTDGSGSGPQKEYAISHTVEGNRSAHGGSAFIPSVSNAHFDAAFKDR
jgi:hypothetical protein